MTRPPPQKHPHRPTRRATPRRNPWTTYATADAPTPATALHHHIAPTLSTLRARTGDPEDPPLADAKPARPWATAQRDRQRTAPPRRRAPAEGRLVFRYCCKLPVHRVSLLLTVVYIAGSWCPESRSPLTGDVSEPHQPRLSNVSSRPWPIGTHRNRRSPARDQGCRFGHRLLRRTSPHRAIPHMIKNPEEPH